MADKKKILVVDDEEQNVKLLSSLLRAEGYETETASNGREAVEKVKAGSPDLVLLDIMMPDMDGYEACSLIKSDPESANTPVVIVSALSDRESKLRGLEVSANEFLTKPIDRIELILRVKNLLRIKEYEDFVIRHNQVLEQEVRKRTYELQIAMDDIEAAHQEIKSSYIETIYRLTLAAEFKDEDTATHIKRISYYCKVLAENIGQSEVFCETIFYAGPMHDIGKIGIPDNILLKPGKLTSEEFEIIKSHTTIGARILSNSSSEFLAAAEVVALTHHERWDGTGYPRGLKGEDIPVIGRIMNIVDQYDSLRSKRPYKVPFSHEQTCDIIIKGDGRTRPEHFDPKIHAAFRDAADEFNRIFEGYQD
ncbi:MAG: response regulator [Nitrospirae bacterium]|nr:response regulator [Nitrospirota bacterium]